MYTGNFLKTSGRLSLAVHPFSCHIYCPSLQYFSEFVPQTNFFPSMTSLARAPVPFLSAKMVVLNRVRLQASLHNFCDFSPISNPNGFSMGLPSLQSRDKGAARQREPETCLYQLILHLKPELAFIFLSLYTSCGTFQRILQHIKVPWHPH